MARRVAGRAARRDEQRGGAHLDAPRPPWPGARSKSQSGTYSVESSRASTEQNSAMPRLWARAAPKASSTSPECSQSRSRRLWNVLNTSWLAKPSRSSARGRSSATNAPVAAKFLRSMISSASVAICSSECSRATSRSNAVSRDRRPAGGRRSGGVRCRPGTSAGRAIAQRRVGVIAQPVRCLHDVGVGVVHDQPRRVVPHHPILAPTCNARGQAPSVAGCPTSRGVGRRTRLGRRA